MTIKITFEYETVEDAIKALATHGGLASLETSPQRLMTVAPEDGAPVVQKRRGRPPRSVAAATGKPAEPKTPETQKAVPEIVAAPAGVPPVVAAPDLKLEDAQAAVERLYAAVNAEACIALLARFGVKRVRDLKKDQYAEFISDAEKAAKGEYNPTAGVTA